MKFNELISNLVKSPISGLDHNFCDLLMYERSEKSALQLHATWSDSKWLKFLTIILWLIMIRMYVLFNVNLDDIDDLYVGHDKRVSFHTGRSNSSGHHSIDNGRCDSIRHANKVWLYEKLLARRAVFVTCPAGSRHCMHYYLQVFAYTAGHLRRFGRSCDGHLFGHRHSNVDRKQALQIQRGRLRKCGSSIVFGHLLHVFVFASSCRV